jgi:hypothetical protein
MFCNGLTPSIGSGQAVQAGPSAEPDPAHTAIPSIIGSKTNLRQLGILPHGSNVYQYLFI